MEDPWFLLRAQLIKELERTLHSLDIENFSTDWENLIEEPPDRKLGDFATTISFQLPKILKKAPKMLPKGQECRLFLMRRSNTFLNSAEMTTVFPVSQRDAKG